MVSRYGALLALALVAQGCRNKASQQSAVDLPTTIEAARKLHDPPAVVVSVERKKKSPSGGGGGCGHSALCILFLPVVFLAPLFPERWDEVRITRAGRLSYEGRFGTDGRFLEATVREETQVRSVGVLPLDQLGRHVIVELARAPLTPAGEQGSFVRSPILPQIDLVREYDAKLATLKEPARRTDLILEFTAWLKDEGIPWLTRVVPAEPQEVAGQILFSLCSSGRHPWKPGCTALLDAIAAKPTPDLAVLALREGTEESPPERTLRLGRFLIAEGCKGDPLPALRGLRFPASVLGGKDASAEQKGLLSALVTDARSCATPRRVHLLAALGERLEEREVAEALSPVGPESEALAGILAADAPAHRRGFLAAIQARLSAGTDEEPLVRWLARSAVAPDAAELELLVTSYLRANGDNLARRRACVLERLARGAQLRSATANARNRVAAAFATAPESERPALAAALVHLGDREQAGVAADAFDGSLFVPHVCNDVKDNNSLAGFALFRAGCTPDETIALQRAAQQKGRKGRDAGPPQEAPRGALCTRAR